jgi:hypothetical protein
MLLVCASMRSAQIGGASMEYQNGLNMTELDSHAKMSVAGSGSTVIARSGHFDMVTSFSPDLPVLEKVEIGDAAMCYDDPVSLRTYILMLRNALLIPTINHNLLPPFLVCEAGLLIDETPKHQAMLPTIDNHLIYNSRTGMRIHLQLQGIFLSFLLVRRAYRSLKTGKIIQLSLSPSMVTPGTGILHTMRRKRLLWLTTLMFLCNTLCNHVLRFLIMWMLVNYMDHLSLGIALMK